MKAPAALVALGVVLLISQTGFGQERAKTAAKPIEGVSCNEFAPAQKQVLGQNAGVEQCRIISEETVFNIKGHKYRRVEIRLTGTVEGWAFMGKGARAIYFTDGPDFVFAQSGLTGSRARGIASYQAETGHGMTILYPEDARHWNGKLFMSAHGAGSYGSVGTLIPRDPSLKFNPRQGVNRYVSTMMDKGYAVAHTMRSSDRLKGDISVTLEDGAKLQNYNLSSHAGLLVGWTRLAQNFIAQRAGSSSKRTYFYGHSAGGFLGRQVNYQPGANGTELGSGLTIDLFHGFRVDSPDGTQAQG